MKYPEDNYNKSQAKFLEGLSQADRPFHAMMFRIGNAASEYHKQAQKEYQPTQQDYEEWLAGLPENIRLAMRAKGFENCRTNSPFTRFVLERRDVGLDEWMKEHLSDEDYTFWKNPT